MKMHYRVSGVDCRDIGQTEYEYTHQSACGYVRDNVTSDCTKVTCQHCLKSIHMVSYHASKAFSKQAKRLRNAE